MAKEVKRAFGKAIFPADVNRAKAQAAAEKAYMAVEEFEPISEYGKGLLEWHFVRTAKALTGRNVRIVWSRVLRNNPQVRGTVRKENAGEDAVIYLKTGMGWDATWKVYLHECGHILKTWSSIWDLGGKRDLFPDSINSKVAAEKVKPLEDKAVKQAAIWFSWARENTPYRQIVRLLTALEDWEP